MGVAGSGKTTVGTLLAQRLSVPFADADAFHSPANVALMSSGTPLTDDDRGPWLASIAAWLAECSESGCVTTCSALRRSYRDVLRAEAPDVCFVYPAGSPELIAARVSHRADHFMPAALVESQFAALEPPAPDEGVLEIDASLPPDEIVAVVAAAARRR